RLLFALRSAVEFPSHHIPLQVVSVFVQRKSIGFYGRRDVGVLRLTDKQHVSLLRSMANETIARVAEVGDIHRHLCASRDGNTASPRSLPAARSPGARRRSTAATFGTICGRPSCAELHAPQMFFARAHRHENVDSRLNVTLDLRKGKQSSSTACDRSRTERRRGSPSVLQRWKEPRLELNSTSRPLVNASRRPEPDVLEWWRQKRVLSSSWGSAAPRTARPKCSRKHDCWSASSSVFFVRTGKLVGQFQHGRQQVVRFRDIDARSRQPDQAVVIEMQFHEKTLCGSSCSFHP
ncbi:hypothetical protein DFJ73DRAFT_944608, partial [Zopfochytrium polystomum]